MSIDQTGAADGPAQELQLHCPSDLYEERNKGILDRISTREVVSRGIEAACWAHAGARWIITVVGSSELDSCVERKVQTDRQRRE